MEKINFSHNWNNKLKTKVFTTIRLHNERKYIIGNKYLICLKHQPLGVAELIDSKKINISALDNFQAMLDTGYSDYVTREVIKQMYKNKNIDWNKQLLDICLFKFDHVEKPNNQCKLL